MNIVFILLVASIGFAMLCILLTAVLAIGDAYRDKRHLPPASRLTDKNPDLFS